MTYRLDPPSVIGMGDVTDLVATLAALRASDVQVCSTNGDVTNATTSLADATGFAFAMLAGKRYFGQFHVRFQINNILGGLSLSLTGPSSTEAPQAAIRIPGGLTGATIGTLRTYDAATTSTSIDAANTDTLAVVECSVRPSVDGFLQVRFARGGIAGTAMIRAGSMGILIAVS